MTQSEFDRFLMDEVSELPPSKDMVAAATPLRTAMNQILWGMVLTVFRLEFFYLQYILPLLGACLLYLGYRSLRQENRWFRLCWLLSGTLLIWHALWAVLIATPVPMQLAALSLSWPLAGAQAVVHFILLFSLRAGLRAAFTATGETKPRDWLKLGILAEALVYAIAIWCDLVPLTETDAIFTFFGPQIMAEWKWLYHARIFAAIALEILLLVCIGKQGSALAGRGYCVTPVPVKYSTRTVLVGVFAAVLLALPPTMYLGGHVSMPEAQVLGQNLTEQQEVTKNRLVSMGLPQGLADILDQSELDACAGALGVYAPTYMGTVKFTEERVKHDNFAVEWAGDAQVRLSVWMVALPDHMTRVYHWFEYLQLPELRLQEQFSIDPTWNYPRSDYAARLVWSEDSVPYACAPEVQLTGGQTADQMDEDALRWHELELKRLGHLHYSPWIDYSIPKKVETMQGYLAFHSDISLVYTKDKAAYLNDFFYFSVRHQTGVLHYPFADMSDLGGTTGSYKHGPMDSFYGAVHFDTIP